MAAIPHGRPVTDPVADAWMLRRTLARTFAHNTALTTTVAMHKVVYLILPLATSAQTLTGIEKRINENGARTRTGWCFEGEPNE